MRALLHGGSVVDGTGRPAFRADLWIENGRIAAVGTLPAQADVTVDCTGLMVAPGFIDGHSHSDLQVLEDGGILSRKGAVDYAVGRVAPGVFLIVATGVARHSRWKGNEGSGDSTELNENLRIAREQGFGPTGG